MSAPRDADLLATAVTLGARLKRATAVEWAGPCPVCGGRDRFGVNTKKRLWNCRGCIAGGRDALSLVMHVRELDFREAVAFLAGEATIPKPARVRPSTEPKDTESNAFVEQLITDIVRELVPVRRTPGEPYFSSVRKIDTDAIADVLERTDAIGWHPSVLFLEQGHPLDGRRLGCIVGIMTDPITAMPTSAISRTYLTPDLAKIGKAKTLGSPAGVVRLTPDDEVLGGLHLAEGLETALTTMSWGLRPMWATGSTALMSKFPVLSGIECLNLIVDNDRNGAGERAAREAEARWRAAGPEVRLLRSDAPGDLNDVLRGAQNEAGRKPRGSTREAGRARIAGGRRAAGALERRGRQERASQREISALSSCRVRRRADVDHELLSDQKPDPARGTGRRVGTAQVRQELWAFDLLMHVALDWEYRGLRVKGGRVVYCALEGRPHRDAVSTAQSVELCRPAGSDT